MNIIKGTKRIEIMLFPNIEVNYELRRTNDFLHQNFSDPNPYYIVSDIFPTPITGFADIGMALVNFNFRMSMNDVLKELDRMGYRPAHICELLVLYEKFPDIELDRPIAALGSAWDYSGKINFAYIPGSGTLSERSKVPSVVLSHEWDTYFHCAAVRK